jgi:hypothetical protein
MQVLVRRSALTLATDEAVPVMAYYEDSVEITADMQRPEFATLSLPGHAIRTGPALPSLAPGWREESKSQIVCGEAKRRILSVFPEHSQRNSMYEVNSYLTEYGTSLGKWPAAAQQRKAEIERCWTYVNAVRNAASDMLKSALAADPTADSHWPTRIAPYQPG